MLRLESQCGIMGNVVFPPLLWVQLYGEYREQLGSFARREAARLLTEKQWRQAGDDSMGTGRKGHGRRHHDPHRHRQQHPPPTLDSHLSHTSSSTTQKPRPYSKCQGDSHSPLWWWPSVHGQSGASGLPGRIINTIATSLYQGLDVMNLERIVKQLIVP